MTDEFDSGILEELTKATKLLTQVSKNISKIMKDMNSRTEESVKKTNKAYDEAYNKADKQNKKNEESTEKQTKMSKTQSDREIVNTTKHLEKMRALDLDNTLKMDRLFARTATRGEGNVMGFIKLIKQQSSMFGGASRMSELEQKARSGQKLSEEERSEYSTLQESTASESPLMPLFKTFDKYFGTGSKWDKFFQGHGKMAAGIIGGGAAGIGATAVMKGVQMAIEASPMLQQMLKLWKFGIMMVLRPIGDFFGFIMRPIMVLMLRKFIIPFYQKYMPIMIKLGDHIGKLVAKYIDEKTGEDAPANYENLISGLEKWLATKDVVITDTQEEIDAKNKARFEAIGDTIYGLLGVLSDSPIRKLFSMFLEKLPSIVMGNAFGALPDGTDQAIKEEFEGGFTDPDPQAVEDAKAIDAQNEIRDLLQEQIDNNPVADAIETIEEVIERMDEAAGKNTGLSQESLDRLAAVEAYNNQITNKLPEVIIPEVIQSYAEKQAERIASYGSMGTDGKLSSEREHLIQTEKSNGVSGGLGEFEGKTWRDYMANGGIIDEPILGTGLRTGKGYMLGESGKEAVIPLNKLGGGGSNITVNIQNMSASQQDLNALRSVILSVVQEANTRRGRI
jgi:hypothetical protein